MKERDNSTNTYLILDTKTGNLKIGIAKDVKRRLKQLQTGASSPLSLLFVLPYNCEKELHYRFKHIRIRPQSEWFFPNPAIISFFENPDI